MTATTPEAVQVGAAFAVRLAMDLAAAAARRPPWWRPRRRRQWDNDHHDHLMTLDRTVTVLAHDLGQDRHQVTATVAKFASCWPAGLPR